MGSAQTSLATDLRAEEQRQRNLKNSIGVRPFDAHLKHFCGHISTLTSEVLRPDLISKECRSRLPPASLSNSSSVIVPGRALSAIVRARAHVTLALEANSSPL